MTLVVGVDPGRRSASVLHLAAMLARSTRTDLLVVAVVPRTWPSSAGSVDAEWRTYTRQSAEAALDHAAAVLGDDVTVAYVVHEAPSARRGLIELAEEHGASLLVIGSSSAGGAGRVGFGSESDALLHASPVPVAIAPRGYRADASATVGRVTAAYRGTEASSDLVRGAAEVAASVGAELRIASFAVVPRTSGSDGAGFDAEDRIVAQWARDIDRDAGRLLSDLAALPDAPLSAGTVLGVGGTWDTAVGDVPWRDDEVLVVGSSSLGPLARVFLGSNAAKLVRHSPVPVVVVPRRALDSGR